MSMTIEEIIEQHKLSSFMVRDLTQNTDMNAANRIAEKFWLCSTPKKTPTTAP